MIGKIDINNPDERGLLPYPVILAATKGRPRRYENRYAALRKLHSLSVYPESP